MHDCMYVLISLFVMSTGICMYIHIYIYIYIYLFIFIYSTHVYACVRLVLAVTRWLNPQIPIRRLAALSSKS